MDLTLLSPFRSSAPYFSPSKFTADPAIRYTPVLFWLIDVLKPKVVKYLGCEDDELPTVLREFLGDLTDSIRLDVLDIESSSEAAATFGSLARSGGGGQDVLVLFRVDRLPSFDEQTGELLQKNISGSLAQVPPELQIFTELLQSDLNIAALPWHNVASSESFSVSSSIESSWGSLLMIGEVLVRAAALSVLSERSSQSELELRRYDDLFVALGDRLELLQMAVVDREAAAGIKGTHPNNPFVDSSSLKTGELEARLAALERELREIVSNIPQSKKVRLTDDRTWIDAPADLYIPSVDPRRTRRLLDPFLIEHEVRALDQSLSERQVHDVVVIKTSGVFSEEGYLARYPEVREAGLDPVIHFVKHGVYEGRSAHVLFSVPHYLQNFPDLLTEGINPLAHCLETYGSEAQSPHPLFDVRFYSGQAANLDSRRISPWAHFVLEGAALGYSPHPYFDSSYYFQHNQDIHQGVINPLAHYLLFGSVEGRKPHPDFDPRVYRFKYRDVADAGLEPLSHFCEFGAQEGRLSTIKPISDYSTYLPATPGRVAAGEGLSSSEVERVAQQSFNSPLVDVIIPVYRDLAVTRRCIESVVGGVGEIKYRILVINDCSPEAELTAYLRQVSASEKICLLENERNLGFVATVNRGMQFGAPYDVVLLNSDTEVPAGWLDRLAAQAYSDSHIGTANPFSNNATICNFPSIAGLAEMPSGDGLTAIDQACAQVNQGRNVEVPTTVGFCMYIKRACLDQVGLFDAETFGAGYGEENEFCLRASRQGWKHIIATDVFVSHEGEKSFGASATKRKEAAGKIISSLYPDYEGDCRRWFAQDPAKPYRSVAAARKFKNSPLPVTLIVEHGLGGGVRRYIDSLVESTSDSHLLILRRCHSYGNEFDLELTSARPEDGINLILRSSADFEFLIHFLESCGVARVSVQHILGFPIDIDALLDALGVPYEVFAHDYLYVCPQIFLADGSGNYCGEPDEVGCMKCLQERPRPGAPDIFWWRAKYGAMLRGAEVVSTPSKDCQERYAKYFPGVNVVCNPHEKDWYCPTGRPVNFGSGSPLRQMRVALLGVLAKHKGVERVLEVQRYVERHGLPIEFKLIGYVEGGLDNVSVDFIEQTGPYAESEALNLINGYDPHLVWLSSLCVETYSYTMSTALKSGRSILAPNMGAFPERCRGVDWTWLYSLGLGAAEIVQVLQSLAHMLEARDLRELSPDFIGEASAIRKPPLGASSLANDHSSHNDRLIAPPARRTVRGDSKSTGKPTARRPRIAVIPERFGGYPSPCAFIRLLLPLGHPKLKEHVELVVTSPDRIEKLSPDLVITHRTALANQFYVDRLMNFCRKNDIGLVYDLDDNLLEVPAHHADYRAYQEKITAVTTLVSGANKVWVSTPALGDVVAKLNADISILRNCLDERIWLSNKLTSAPGEWSDEHVRFLYMGTRTHDEDFELVRPAFRKLYRKYGQRFHLDIIGALNSRYSENWLSFVDPNGVAAASYPGFVGWLRSANRYQVGIAPLVESDFTRCKSGIKCLDYAALGLVSLVSEGAPYRTVDLDSLGALAVDASADSWFDSLEYLLLNHEERNIRRWQAYMQLAFDHTVGAQWEVWVEAIYSALSRKPSDSTVRNESILESFLT